MDSMLYGLDIETDTTTGGLDPSTSAIIAVAVSTADKTVQQVFTGSEPTLLADLHNFLNELPSGIIVTWNGSSFDLQFIETRSKMFGIATRWELNPSKRPPKYSPVGGTPVRAVLGSHAHADIAYAYQETANTLNVPWSLKPVAVAFGMNPVEVDRENTHLLTASELHDYVVSDAYVTAVLASRLTKYELDSCVD